MAIELAKARKETWAGEHPPAKLAAGFKAAIAARPPVAVPPAIASSKEKTAKKLAEPAQKSSPMPSSSDPRKLGIVGMVFFSSFLLLALAAAAMFAAVSYGAALPSIVSIAPAVYEGIVIAATAAAVGTLALAGGIAALQTRVSSSISHLKKLVEKRPSSQNADHASQLSPVSNPSARVAAAPPAAPQIELSQMSPRTASSSANASSTNPTLEH